MKFKQILCAIFVLIVLHLTLFVSASTIQRSLSDDIRNGISIAGKILGVDSPASIAVVSNVAELVSRAFSKDTNTNPPNGWDRRQMSERYPPEHLEDFGEAASNYHPTNSNEQGTIDDNVIVGSNVNTNPTTTTPTTGINYGFMGQVLRIMGMDTSKIGSLAINGIIFIAQMIGRSFMSAFSNMTNRMSAKPDLNVNINERNRRLNDDDGEGDNSSFWENTVGWILERSKSNDFLSQQLDVMLDRSLPERLVSMVDNGNNDEIISNERTDCIKQLLCKTAPFIWGMQKAVTSQMNNSNADITETDESAKINEKTATVDDDVDERTSIFFKYLPTTDEFKDHGITCEDLYKQCKLF